ncbi:MAG: phytoene desaturase family protein [Alphaproteobacteria bacterium]
MFKRKNIIIIGGGVNGLSAALELSRRPFSFLCRKITIIEGDKTIGGLARHADYCYGLPKTTRSQLFWGGFRLGKKMTSIVLGGNEEQIMITPTRKGTKYVGLDRTLAKNHHRLEKKLRRYIALWKKIATTRPPQLKGRQADIINLIKIGWAFKLMRKKSQYEFLKIITQNVDDVFNEHLAEGNSQALTSLWNFHSYHGSGLYATHSGSMTALWFRQSHDKNLGLSAYEFYSQKFFRAFERILKMRGVAIETEKKITAITSITKNHQQTITGIKLTNGKTMPADIVLSTLTPHRTINLVGAREFDGELVRRSRHVRGRALVAKMIITPKSLPEIFAHHKKKPLRVIITAGRQALEHQFLDSKYQSYPSEFPIAMTLRHNKLWLQIFNQPLRANQNANQVKKIVLTQLKKYFPDMVVQKADIILPNDMLAYAGGENYNEKNNQNFPKSHPAAWHHADMALDQTWLLRPINGLASGASVGFSHYRTPIKNLYVGGASCHPGGDLNGMAGILAAKTIIKTTKQKNKGTSL